MGSLPETYSDLIQENLTCGIRNPKNQVRNPSSGIKNPRLSWIPLYGVKSCILNCRRPPLIESWIIPRKKLQFFSSETFFDFQSFRSSYKVLLTFVFACNQFPSPVILSLYVVVKLFSGKKFESKDECLMMMKMMKCYQKVSCQDFMMFQFCLA